MRDTQAQYTVRTPGGVEQLPFLTASRGGVLSVLAYSAAISLDLSVLSAAGLVPDRFTVTPTNAVAFAISLINTPLAIAEQEFEITIINTTGGALGAMTLTAGALGFRAAAWVQPATGFSKTARFRWTGAVALQITTATVDIPN